MSEYGGYVDQGYLERSAELVNELKRRSLEQLGLNRGASVLDVGCGPGIDTADLGAIVGPTGRVVGVDADADMVELASKRAEEFGVRAWVEHQHADASRLPFPDDEFDGVHSERLIQHLADPSETVEEFIRVVKPGGRVVVVDTDWASLSVDTTLTSTARRLFDYKTYGLTRNGPAGRQLLRLLRDANLENIQVEPFALYSTLDVFKLIAMWDELVEMAVRENVASLDEVQALDDELQERERRGAFFGTLNLVLASATKSDAPKQE